MSLKIYSAPKEIKIPQIDYMNYNQNDVEQNETSYINQLKEYLLQKGYKGKNFGEIINFQVADSYAEYMVLSMKPLQLMHLPLNDGYHYQYIERLTVNDIQKKIDSQISF